MASSPPLISGLIKLTSLTRLKIERAYDYGFVSLRTAEPSMGVPLGRTLTEQGSAYFFPVIALGSTYRESRKFTGFDTLILKNRRLGFNNPNPVFTVDVSGSMRAINAEFLTLSASRIEPVPGSGNTLTITHSAVNFNSDVNFRGTTVGTNVTATRLLTHGITAQNVNYTNTIVTLYTLTAAELDRSLNVTGTLSAIDVTVRNKITSPQTETLNLVTNTLTANNLTVTNLLSVKDDIYATKIFGQVNLDPLAPLTYNNNNQLTFTGNINYDFVVHPTDSYSTDSLDVVRSLDGPYDTDKLFPGANTSDNERTAAGAAIFKYKPFFKTIQGVFNYLDRTGIFGNQVVIRLFGDHVFGEQLSATGFPDRSGQYSSLTTRTGNLTSAFYSTDWLRVNAPALFNAGIRGGEFIWSNNGNSLFGDVAHLTIGNLNFKNVWISGQQNIGTTENRNTPKDSSITALVDEVPNSSYYDFKQYYYPRKVYNFPPANIAFRVYVSKRSDLSFGQFGTDPANWTEQNTFNSVKYTPVYIDALTTSIIRIRNTCFEINSNANFSTGIFVEKGYVEFGTTTIALLGTSVYTHGALCGNSPLVRMIFNNGDGMGASMNPILLENFEKLPSAFANLDGAPHTTREMYPGYGLALVGNPAPKPPTIIWNVNNSDTGFFRFENGTTVRMPDYGTERQYGFRSQVRTSIYLAGRFNCPSFFYLANNTFLYSTDQLLAEDNDTLNTYAFALSTRFIRYNNIGIGATGVLEFYDEAPELRYNFQHVKFGGAFSYFNPLAWGIRSFEFVQVQPQIFRSASPLFSINRNSNDRKYLYTDNTTVDLSGSVAEIGTFNQIEGYSNIIPAYTPQNRFLKVTTPEDLPKIKQPGYGRITQDPIDPTRNFAIDYYSPSRR